MPKYQNRSGHMVEMGEYVWAPFETKVSKMNLYFEPPIIKIDDEPKNIPYEMIIEGAVTNSVSTPFLHQHSRIIRIDDKFPDIYNDDSKVNSNADGSKISIGIFATVGPFEKNSSYQLIRIMNFTKQFGEWIADTPEESRIPQQLLDVDYEVIYLKVLAFNGSKVDISLKKY